jgi:hypothetical protein
MLSAIVHKFIASDCIWILNCFCFWLISILRLNFKLYSPLIIFLWMNTSSELGNNQAPGPDSIPTEFLLMFGTCWGLCYWTFWIWASGIEGSVTFLKGLLVLLYKKGAQTSLGNERGNSLMNLSYKIGTKVYQKRLPKVLVKMMSHQQYAYLPGRSVHVQMFLTEEMIHRAK